MEYGSGAVSGRWGTAPKPGPPTVRGHTVRLQLPHVVGDQRRDADANRATIHLCIGNIHREGASRG
jgi:hypothetical protein